MRRQVLIVVLAVASCCQGTNRPKKMRTYLDLSYWLSDDTQIWPGHLPFNMTTLRITGLIPRTIQSEAVIHSSHFSTHIDAPIHFREDGWTLDQIPQNHLQGPGVTVDVRAKASRQPNYAVTKEDMLEHEARYGRIPNGAIVFLNTGWSMFWNDTVKYLGTDSKDLSKLAYPGLGKTGAEFLVFERDVKGVCTDSIGIDAADNAGYEAHIVLADANKWGIEATANVHLLPPNGFEVYAFPLKLYKSSGGSVRVAAFL